MLFNTLGYHLVTGDNSLDALEAYWVKDRKLNERSVLRVLVEQPGLWKNVKGDHIIVSLLDPSTQDGSLIRFPIRTRLCSHFQCFDASVSTYIILLFVFKSLCSNASSSWKTQTGTGMSFARFVL